MHRLAIICSHPIQYYAPWFVELNKRPELEIHVFYLWDYGQQPKTDPEFEQTIIWDLDLLSGYESTFVPNISKKPGTTHFFGLINPRLYKHVDDFKPNACLVYGYAYLSLLWFIKRAANKYPLIFRGDSHLLGRTKQTSFKDYLIKYIYASISAALYTGKANKEYFLKYGLNKEQLFFAPHSVDNKRFEKVSIASDLRIQLKLSEDTVVFLFVGKFISKKRPLELFKAFEKANLSNSHLLYIGNGELKEQLNEATKNNGNVTILPFKNQTEISAFYKLADVIVLPSQGYYETWGLTINEAFCCDTAAIVSSQVGCAMDLVQDQDTGVVFQSEDLDSLTDALVKAAEDPVTVARWKANARNLIKSYSYEECTKALLNTLEYINE